MEKKTAVKIYNFVVVLIHMYNLSSALNVKNAINGHWCVNFIIYYCMRGPIVKCLGPKIYIVSCAETPSITTVSVHDHDDTTEPKVLFAASSKCSKFSTFKHQKLSGAITQTSLPCDCMQCSAR